jgi:hypothetical protein
MTLVLSACGGANGSYAFAPANLARPEHANSWMSGQNVKQGSELLYVGDAGTDEVDVFGDFPEHTRLVGVLTGFHKPQGMCVDRTGDVFIANNSSGVVDEYRHGGTTPINRYDSEGSAVGCSISASGDLAVTDQTTGKGSGQVCIWEGGGRGRPQCAHGTTSCYYLWTFGYDDKGNLIGNGTERRTTKVTQCELRSGSSNLIALSRIGF